MKYIDNERTQYFDEKSYDLNCNAKTGIFLIHGFSSTTYELKKLAKFLADKDFFVRFENLPGHALCYCTTALRHGRREATTW